jgi:hypothetical protein
MEAVAQEALNEDADNNAAVNGSCFVALPKKSMTIVYRIEVLD